MYTSHWHSPHPAMYVIKRAKHQGIGEHFGLALPNSCVVDFGADTGIRITDMHTFGAGKDVVADRQVSEVEHMAVYEPLRWAQLQPAAYDFWNWNCECFVNFLVGEEPRSDQVRLLGVVLAVAAVAAVMARTN